MPWSLHLEADHGIFSGQRQRVTKNAGMRSVLTPSPRGHDPLPLKHLVVYFLEGSVSKHFQPL